MSSFFEIAINIILPIFLVAGIGGAYKQIIGFDTSVLGNLLFYILIPVLVIDGLSATELPQDELVQLFGMVTAITLILMGLSYVVANMLGLSAGARVSFMLCAMLMNAANYGIPVNEFAFGAEGRELATIFFICTAVMSNSVGIYTASSGNLPPLQAARSAIMTPIFGATVLGVLLNFTNVTIPLPLDRAIKTTNAATVPIMLLFLGSQLVQIRIQGSLVPIVVATGLRLVVSPLLAVVGVWLLGFEGTLADVSIVESGTPAAVFVVVLTERYRADTSLATSIILVSTIVSIVTVSIILSVL